MPLRHSRRGILLVLLFAIIIGFYWQRKGQTLKAMESNKPVPTVENDFDARLEQKLEQLKEVQTDQAWYQGEFRSPCTIQNEA